MDTKTLSALIESIYAAGVGACSWHAVVTDVARAFGERGGILYEFDARVRQSQVLGSTPVDPAMIRQYEQYYGSIDALHHRVVREPTLETNATHNLIRDAELEQSEFYSDYFRHLDFFYAMGTVVRREAGRTAVLGVQRSRRRGHFDARDFDTMQILAQHTHRSLEIADRLQRASGSSIEGGDFGFLLLGSSSKVVFATESAERLLRMAGIGFAAGRLRADGALGRRLEALLNGLARSRRKEKATGGHLDIDLPAGGRLSLLASSASPSLAPPAADRHACLLVQWRPEPSDRSAVLRRRFGLTAAETALALALAEGETLRDLAQARGCSINTLRVQLQSVFAKTGCHRQSELVRLILRLPPV